MPIYSNALTQRPANMLAYQDSMSATPRNQVLGYLADLAAASYAPQRTQQMQGLAQFLSAPAISQTLDRLSYGEPLTTGAGMTTRIRPEALEAAMAVAPAAQPVTMATLAASRLARQAAFATRGLPVGMSTEAVGGMGFLRPQAPQEQALRLAQQRAALPPSQGGLGLPANNTAQQRLDTMFPVDVYHGSRDPSIMALDPSLAGKSTSNAFDQNIWATSSPEVARGYSLDTKQFALTPEAKEINAKIQGLSEKYNAAYQSGKFDEMDKLREKINLAQSQSKDLYKSFLKGDIASEGATIYPLRMSVDDLMPYEAGGKNWMSVNRKALEEAKSRGYGGVNIKNVSDNTQASNKVISDTYATENPDLFRSRFAAGDPWRRTAATAALYGVAAPDLLAAESQDDINKMRKLKANQK